MGIGGKGTMRRQERPQHISKMKKKKGFIGLTIISYRKYLFSIKCLKPKVILGLILI